MAVSQGQAMQQVRLYAKERVRSEADRVSKGERGMKCEARNEANLQRLVRRLNRDGEIPLVYGCHGWRPAVAGFSQTTMRDAIKRGLARQERALLKPNNAVRFK